MIKIGDYVRCIPSDYIALSKGDFINSLLWEEPSKNQEFLMLGGEYRVISIKRLIFLVPIWYELLEGKMISKTYIKLSKSVRICKFKVGEKVVFNPKCSESDLVF